MQARNFQYLRDVRKIGQKVDRSEWFMSPQVRTPHPCTGHGIHTRVTPTVCAARVFQTANAYYAAFWNDICVPVAMLQARDPPRSAEIRREIRLDAMVLPAPAALLPPPEPPCVELRLDGIDYGPRAHARVRQQRSALRQHGPREELVGLQGAQGLPRSRAPWSPTSSSRGPCCRCLLYTSPSPRD